MHGQHVFQGRESWVYTRDWGAGMGDRALLSMHQDFKRWLRIFC